jgi:putative PIG3 family NAD(P)H quinone oxidoreductase
MKAIQVLSEQKGQPMVWQETGAPVCGPDDVLVDVYAASVNRADLLQRAGKYPPPPGAPDILGLDMAGQIVQVGGNVTGWQPGDRACALLPGGGYAEQVAVPYQTLMPIPQGWSYEQAAAMPEVFLTAFLNIFIEAGFQPGEFVLMHGGASGVGTAAIQLVKAAGGRIVVTAGSHDKVLRCLELGADLAINYREDDFVRQIRQYTADRGVDIILDIVGADYLERNLSLLAPQGRLVFIATMGGSRAELNIAALMGRRLRLIGSVLRSRSVEEKAAIKERFVARFWPALEDGAVQPAIDSIYPIEQAGEAHQRMAENRNMGKIVLKVR